MKEIVWQAIITVLCGWAVYKLDRTLTIVVELRTIIIGPDGGKGMVADVEDHERRISGLESEAPTRYLPKG